MSGVTILKEFRASSAHFLFALVFLAIGTGCPSTSPDFDNLTTAEVPVLEEFSGSLGDWLAVFSLGGGQQDPLVLRIRSDGYAVAGRESNMGLRSGDFFPSMVRKLSDEQLNAIRHMDIESLKVDTPILEIEPPAPDSSGSILYWTDSDGSAWLLRDAESTAEYFSLFTQVIEVMESDFTQDPSGCLLSMGEIKVVRLEEGGDLPLTMDDSRLASLAGDSDSFLTVVPQLECVDCDENFAAFYMVKNYAGSGLAAYPVALASVLDMASAEVSGSQGLADFGISLDQNICVTFDDAQAGISAFNTFLYFPDNLIEAIPGSETPVYRSVLLSQNF